MLGTLSELGFSLIPWHPAATSLSRWARHMQDVMVTSKDAWWKSADDTRECRTGQGSCVLQSRVGVPMRAWSRGIWQDRTYVLDR